MPPGSTMLISDLFRASNDSPASRKTPTPLIGTRRWRSSSWGRRPATCWCALPRAPSDLLIATRAPRSDAPAPCLFFRILTSWHGVQLLPLPPAAFLADLSQGLGPALGPRARRVHLTAARRPPPASRLPAPRVLPLLHACLVRVITAQLSRLSRVPRPRPRALVARLTCLCGYAKLTSTHEFGRQVTLPRAALEELVMQSLAQVRDTPSPSLRLQQVPCGLRVLKMRAGRMVGAGR
jgi:hypothetical protein